MINQNNGFKTFEESKSDDTIIVIQDYQEEDDEKEWIECMDCVQRKMICLITILIIGTILLIFAYTINR